MKTYQVTKRDGERMGDIDYSFDFRSHYDSCCTSIENRDAYCASGVALLKEVERRFKSGEILQVRFSDWWRDLVDVGMYDGWPYWRQTPAVLTHSTLGAEWQFWYDIREVRVKP